MRTIMTLSSLVLCAALCGCGQSSEPIPPPTTEAIIAFAEAAFNGNSLQVATALENGMPVDQKDADGNNGLMLASFNGHVGVIQILLDAGADINLRDGNGRTALMFAASGPFPAAVRLLVENGSEVNATDSVENFTPLMFAASEGLSPLVDILLAAGADPTMKDVDDDTAASFAKQRGFTALANKLQALIDAP